MVGLDAEMIGGPKDGLKTKVLYPLPSHIMFASNITELCEYGASPYDSKPPVVYILDEESIQLKADVVIKYHHFKG